MNRAELQQLADDRMVDAASLLDAGRWSAAYYLAGYAVECALKACALAHLIRTDAVVIFEDRKYSENCWTHDAEKLIRVAGLEEAYATATSMNGMLDRNWRTVKDWREGSRYEQKSEAESRKLIGAISESADGVLQWIKEHW